MLLVLWYCGLVGMIVVARRREEPGEGHCWMAGSLAGWRVERVGWFAGLRFKYIELDSLGSV